jgi:hypothetical protein
MNRKLMPESCPKAVYSVTEVARSLELSRARFYQLVQEGVFPTPVYDIRSRRPYYTVELQQRCHQVRQTNIGQNGLPILFYSPRQNLSEAKPMTLNKSKKRKETPSDPIFQELAESLQRMGICDTTPELVEDAFTKLHSDKTPEGMDAGILLRELFRYFRKGQST